MLEVRNLSKIYKTKNGTDVKALDNVSIQFPEKGMVFLLGKSGSGKSTLLNVCGGLDAPTTGEIIVKGKSSEKFSQGDFDSYRNTFVGFIFQEYNILNEFSVEDNIALALELQGKPKDKKAVAELLKQVDLEGYAKRKPNTLSGGQKQRIAIARALVKSPEIIMADEPTGALDSATGKQVFETLKKLSEDKLVLVVSHDREFAEQYGDRIIELKDGQVLSDVTKTQEKQQALSENIHTVGEVLCIKNGEKLSDTDFDAIKKFLQKSSGDIIIANNEKDVQTFKKASHITEDGEREVFCDTKEDALEKKVYRPEDSRFIRSKLPARHAIKIGLSSLKTKPVRLFFTILLCTIAFVLFGLLSTMSFYDSESTFKQTMLDSTHTLFRVGKVYQAKETIYQNGEESYEYDTILEGRFSEADLEDLKNKFSKDAFGGVPIYWDYNVRSSQSNYWNNQIEVVAFLAEDNTLRGNISGNYPANKDEICISSYMADVIINCKTYDDSGNVIDVTTRDELLGKKMVIDGNAYKIVGIMDSGVIPEKYEELKSPENENNQLTYQLQTELADGLHFTVFVSPDRLAKIAEEYEPYTGEKLVMYRRIGVTSKTNAGKYNFPEWSNASYEQMANLSEKQRVVYTNGEKATLADGEVLVSQRVFVNLLYERYIEKSDEAAARDDWNTSEKLRKTMDIIDQVSNRGIWKENKETKKSELIPFTEEELVQKTQQVLAAIKKDGVQLTIGAKLFADNTQTVYGDLREFSVAGVLVSTKENADDLLYVSDSVMEAWWNEQKTSVDYYSVTTSDYKDDANAIYGAIFLQYDHSVEQTNEFWEMYSTETFGEDGSRVRPSGGFIDRLEMVDSLVKELSKVFLYVGLVLAVFAALLLSNFISVSISQKKKEIGILRAVGARSLDVFKIFFSESFFISALCVIFASTVSIVVCGILNAELAVELGASLFVFGIPSLVVLIAIALVTTVVATFLPVWNAAKKKPVDSIRAL